MTMNPFRILLVRNENVWSSQTEEVLRSSLAHLGATQMMTMSTGEEAVDQAAADSVDVVIAELVLPKPGISGCHVLRRVREHSPGCRTVLVSDHEYVGRLLGDVTDVFLTRSREPSTSALGLQLAGVVNDFLANRGPTPKALEAPRHFDSKEATIEEGVTREERPQPRLVAGKYRLGTKLGEGGMGEVFQAEDVFIHRSVAVKLLRVQSSKRTSGSQERMHREIMIAGRLTHPNIVTVHDAGFDGTGIYLVMALIRGQTLRQLIREGGSLAPREAIRITRQILEALNYAHGEGVIHRDLKPANVLLTHDLQVKVADFGLAKLRSLGAEGQREAPSAALRELTDVGTVMGTLGYMAPEQVLGQAADCRSDLFSLGTILFEMLRGQPLADFIAPLKLGSLLRLGKELPKLPSLPDETGLDRMLRKALAIRPQDRYQDCDEWLDDTRNLRLEGE